MWKRQLGDEAADNGADFAANSRCSLHLKILAIQKAVKLKQKTGENVRTAGGMRTEV